MCSPSPAEPTRAAVDAWGLETVCAEPDAHSPSLTAVFTPDGHSADNLRKVVLEKYDMSLGTGLGRRVERRVVAD